MIKLRRGYFGLTFTCALCAGAFGAQAADLYRNPPPQTSYVPPAAYVDNYSWAGFYAGINGGYGWSNSGNAIQYNGGIVDSDSSGRSQPSGGFGGGQIGYNFQAGSFVYGLEADFQGGSIGDRTTGFTAVNGYDYNTHEDVDWFGTVRGRLGYAFGRTLIYGTGGFAYGDVHQRALINDPVSGNSALLRNSDIHTGYSVGGGIEYKLTPAWSLKGEYQYIDLGSEKLSGADSLANPVATNALDTNFSVVKLGLNYRFGGGAEPLK